MTSPTRASIGRQSSTREAHVGQHLLERRDDLRAPALVVDALEMDVDEAFARARRAPA